MLLTGELNKKIEFARELYNIKSLNEKFEDEEYNKLRKNKLNKLLENTLNDKKSIPPKQAL
jgi:hypothetical protein